MTELTTKRCTPCEGGIPALDKAQIETLMKQLNHWTYDEKANEIIKIFTFKDYYQTMSFVNAIAWMAHMENHHPDLEVSYNKVVVHYSTHAIKGLSDNDFICAAKIDALIVN